MDDNIPSLDDLLKSVREDDKSKSSSALAVVSKKSDDLVEEDIDSQILSILGLEDIFDLTYEEYASLLKEASIKGRMTNSQMSTESVELVTTELKRVRGKTGKFKVKPKKVDINKVFNRRTASPTSAIVKAQKLLPSEKLEPEAKPETDTLQEDLTNGIGNILESLITIRSVLQSQGKTDQQIAKEDRKETQKKKKKERESTLEKKKPQSPILKALTKPVDDFFGAIKRFFTNVLLGSVVLGMFKWLKDPANQGAIDSFTNFLEKNAGLILGGLLAIASLPLIAPLLSLTGAITGIAIPALKAAFAFLASPAGLLALGTAAGVGLGLAAVKGLEVVAKNLIYGGGSFTEAEESLNKKLFAAGMDKDGIPQVRRQGRNFKSGKPRTAEQEKIFKEVESERNRIRKLRTERDAELKKMEEENNKIINKIRQENTVRSGRGTKISGEGQKELEEQNQKFKSFKESMKEKYTALINKDQSVSKPQPQTPLMPSASSGESEKSEPESTAGGVKVVKMSHPDTGEGYGIPGVVDEQGRPAVFSKPGAEAFAKMMKDSGGKVKGSDIASSKRSPAKNAAVGGASGSKHMTGTAMDIHGVSNSWIRQHGAKYGWVAHDYAGSHGGHFIFKGPGIKTPSTTTTPSAQVARTTAPTPSIPSPTGRGNIVPLPIPAGGQQQSQSNSAPLQASVPGFSSEDPNNTTTMVVRAIYNIVG